MNFFAHQAEARAKSRRMIWLFALAVLAIVAAIDVVVLLVFGVVFELPLVLSVLAMLGIVSAKSLWKFNRYAILIFAIAGAVLTPGDLVIGQLAMAGSLTVLYNLSIAIAWLVERKRSEAEVAETADDEKADAKAEPKE